MAEEPATPKTKLKSKWGRLISKDKNSGNFKLNEDVVDFLKPSTDKYSADGTRQWSSAPRIDVAITSRWPDAQHVKRAAAADGTTLPYGSEQQRSNGKAKKKKNLKVAFAKTAPEIIGEGGDEVQIPVIEVSRMKARHSRSFSDRPLSSDRRLPALELDTAAADEHRHANNYPQSAPARDVYARPNMQRAQTTGGDAMKQTMHSHSQITQPPRQTFDEIVRAAAADARPGLLKRAPTNFSALDEVVSPDYEESPDSPGSPVEGAHPLPRLPSLPFEHAPSLRLDLDPPTSPEPASQHRREPSSPQETSSPPFQPQSRLFVSKARNGLDAEGAAFRRVSRLVFNDDDLADLRSPSSRSSRSSMDMFSPQRAPPVPQHLTMHLSPDRLSDSSEQESDLPAPDENRADSLRPKPPLIVGPPLDPQQSESGASTPRRNVSIEVPRIDTSCDDKAQSIDCIISPDDRRSGRFIPPTIADILSPTSSASTTPNALALNYAQSRSHSQADHYQGITPTPGMEPSSYFPPQANSRGLSPSLSSAPNRPAASPSLSVDTHRPSVSPSLSGEPYTRPSSKTSTYTAFSLSDAQPDSVESVAYRDFDSRVAHMRGVFRLTAERECPISSVSSRQWLRAAIWWLHKGRAGLGQVVRSGPLRGPDGQKREILTQPHVDVAKTWWILNDMIEDESLRPATDIVRNHLKSLALSMQRNGVMPPHQSLIQGQDTTIWITYPRFAPHAASLLHGSTSLMLDDSLQETDPLEALPAGDSKTAFFYNRMFVDVSVNTDESETDRVVLPCILTMLRARTDYQPTVRISSQSDLVNVLIKPAGGGHGKGPTWRDVSWKSRSHGLYLQLPRGFSLNVDLQESDFRGLWNMIEYTRKIEASFAPHPDERLVHDARLVELQYSDSSNPQAFPRERVRACSAFIFEKIIKITEGTGLRKFHRGFRLLLVTSPINKTLSSVTHELCTIAPFLFENIGNPAANEAPAMVIRIQEPKRSCKVLLLFSRASERQHFYDTVNGMTLTQGEVFIGKAPLKSVSIEAAATATPASIISSGGALASLRWDGLRIINKPSEGGQDSGNTVLSENFRIIASHEVGGFTDRLNLGKFFCQEIVCRLVLMYVQDLANFLSVCLLATRQAYNFSVDHKKT